MCDPFLRPRPNSPPSSSSLSPLQDDPDSDDMGDFIKGSRRAKNRRPQLGGPKITDEAMDNFFEVFDPQATSIGLVDDSEPGGRHEYVPCVQ